MLETIVQVRNIVVNLKEIRVLSVFVRVSQPVLLEKDIKLEKYTSKKVTLDYFVHVNNYNMTNNNVQTVPGNTYL